jgi:ribosomal protein S18 acetylase RimI-like enzyme
MHNILLHKQAATSQFLWAEYPCNSGKVITEETNELHANWFARIGIPSHGPVFDRIARGIAQVNSRKNLVTISSYNPKWAPNCVWKHFKGEFPTYDVTEQDYDNFAYDDARFQFQAAAMPFGDVKNLLTEMMKDVEGNLPPPDLKIVNHTKPTWNGRCTWTYGNPTTTIELQKSITHDELTLRRVLAHELAHHEAFLAHFAKMPPQSYRTMWRIEGGHGKTWMDIVARWNAKYGADFITRTSDQTKVHVFDEKPIYVLLRKAPNGMRWQSSINLSPQSIRAMLNAGAKTPDRATQYKLVRTTDRDFLSNLSIGSRNFGYSTDAAVMDKALKLFEEGTDLWDEFTATAATTAKFFVLISKRMYGQEGGFLWQQATTLNDKQKEQLGRYARMTKDGTTDAKLVVSTSVFLKAGARMGGTSWSYSRTENDRKALEEAWGSADLLQRFVDIRPKFRFSSLLLKAAPITDMMRSQIYYHGTGSESAAQDIIKNGIQPRDVIMPEKAKSRAQLAPVPDRVYLTSDRNYAAIYALGGPMFGSAIDGKPPSSWLQNRLAEGEYGYIFEIHGNQLSGDVVPDEDSIGDALYWLMDGIRDNQRLYELNNGKPERYKGELDGLKRSLEIVNAQPINHQNVPTGVRWELQNLYHRFVTDRQKQRLEEIGTRAQVGKKLQKYLSQATCQWMIENGAHVAHQGAIHPTNCWRFSKEAAVRTKDLNSILEQVPLPTKTAKVASTGFLYHGTSQTAYDEIMANGGGMVSPSWWGTEEVAEYYAEVTAEEIGEDEEMQIIAMPIHAFDKAALIPDENSIEEPLTYLLGQNEQALYAEWEKSDKTWEDSLRIYGSVRYNKPINISMAKQASPDFGYKKYNDREQDLAKLEFKSMGGSGGTTFKGIGAYAPREMYPYSPLKPGDKKLVGYIEVGPWQDKQTYAVYDVSVEDEWRGTGLGQMLYDKGVEIAKAAGAKYLTSSTDMQPDAKKAWKRLSQRYPVRAVKDPEATFGKRWVMDLQAKKAAATTVTYPKKRKPKAYHFQPLSFEDFCREQGFTDYDLEQIDDLEMKKDEYAGNVEHFGTLDFPCTIYRALELPEGQSVNLDEAGIYWTWVENSADAYWGGSSMWSGQSNKSRGMGGKGKLYIIKAQVLHPNDVDWQGTLRANFIDPEENELRVLPGAELKLLGVQQGDDWSYKPVPGKMTITASFHKRYDHANLPNFYDLFESGNPGCSFGIYDLLGGEDDWQPYEDEAERLAVQQGIDLDEMKPEDKDQWIYDNVAHADLEAKYNKLREFFSKLQFPLPVYRAIDLKEGLTELRTQETHRKSRNKLVPWSREAFGHSWAWDEKGADNYGSNYQGSNEYTYVFRGEILSPKDIDWETTLQVNFMMPEEHEIRVLDGRQMKITGYRKPRSKKWLPPEESFKMVTSSAKKVDMERLKTILKELRDEEGSGQCHTMADILEHEFGWEKESGFYLYNDSKKGHNGHGDHAWNVMKDGTIIDATHDQFGVPDIAVLKPGMSEYKKYHAYCGDYNCPICTCPECNESFAEEAAKAKSASHKQTPFSDTTFPNMDKNDGEGSNAYALQPERVEGNSLMPSLDRLVPGAKIGDLEGDGPSSFFEEVENPHSVQPLRASFAKGASEWDDEDYGDTDSPNYTSGECWQYAIALVELTGYVPYIINDSEEGPIHGVVLHPSNKFLDASGLKTIQTLGKKYGLYKPFATPTSVEGLAAMCDPTEEEIEDAKKVAVKQLKKLGVPMKTATAEYSAPRLPTGAGDTNIVIPRHHTESPALHNDPVDEETTDQEAWDAAFPTHRVGHVNNDLVWLKQYLTMSERDKGEELARAFYHEFAEYIEQNYPELAKKIPDSVEDDYLDDYSWIPDEVLTGFLDDESGHLMQVSPADCPSFMHMSYEGIVKNQWLVHKTDDPDGICEKGFTIGMHDLSRLGLTTWTNESGKQFGGYNFAFLPEDRGIESKYGKDAVIFRASGVKVYHWGDEETQVIFRGSEAHDIIPVYKSSNDGNWHLSDNAQGNPVYAAPKLSQIVQWVEAHYTQYRKVIVKRAWEQQAPPYMNDYDIYENHFDDEQTVASHVLEEYAQHRNDPNYRMDWDLVPAARLVKIWNDYMSTGFVRDVKGIDMVAEIILTNIAKLNVNTILCGHGTDDPITYASGITGAEYPDDYFDNDNAFFEDDKGSWLISDYALKPLAQDEMKLRQAKNPEQKLQVIDHILNIIHQRSDLAGWFVEGGQATLNRLAGTGDSLKPDLKPQKPSPNPKRRLPNP